MRSKLSATAVALFLVLYSMRLHATGPDTSSRNSLPTVTPVAGESWLNHLHRSFGVTSMGKTGRLGPPASDQEQDPQWRPALSTSSTHNQTLHGQDLYRLNCQGCHGEGGLGAPPEIHSVIDPVRATSAALIVERMKQRGMDINRGAAAELAKQAKDALVQRLHNGGVDMPAFGHLTEAEDYGIIEYLKQLSGMTEAKQVAVAESPVRVGELIVKSTCHVCHDATGPNPTPAQLEDGAIPPLDKLTARADESQFIRKVTSGAPILMGTPPTLHRGRMPVFYYLSEEEAADAYLYLSTYAPSRLDAAAPAMAATQQDSEPKTPPPDTPRSPTPLRAAVVAPLSTTSDGIPDVVVTLSLIGLSAMVLAVLCGGVAFGAFELRRLGRNGEKRKQQMAGYPRPNAVMLWPSELKAGSSSDQARKSKETIHVACF